MAHFAKIEDDVVIQVIVVDNKELQNKEFPESEPLGQKFIQSIGLPGEWKQTSYNANFRGHYAGAGFIYDREKDCFIPPQPYPSWQFDEKQLNWVAPKPHPTDDGTLYYWDEDEQEWISEPDYEVE